MPTHVMQVDAGNPEEGPIARAAALLRGGGLVAFPTETVYGLGANALDAAAVERIFEAKGRPAHNPIIVHIGDAGAALPLVRQWPAEAGLLAERFWPGALTLVLPKSARVPEAVTAGGPTVALRIPSHPVALALLRAARLPVAAPERQPLGRIISTCAEHVLRGLGGRIDLVLDAGPTPGGLESTVLDLTVAPARALAARIDLRRPSRSSSGPYRQAQRRRFFGDPEIAGQLDRHYAPRTPLEIAADDGWARVEALCKEGLRVGWLTVAGEERKAGADVVTRQLPADVEGFTSQLYAALHELDAAGLDRIVVSRPPETDEWLAVRDRLRRAAG